MLIINLGKIKLFCFNDISVITLKNFFVIYSMYVVSKILLY